MRKFFLLMAMVAYGWAAQAADPMLVPFGKGGEYARLSADKRMLLRGNYQTGREDTLVVFQQMKVNPLDRVEAFSVSANGGRVLLRYSDRNHYVYTFATRRCEKLSAKGAQSQPIFSHDGNLVAFLRQGDVYLTDLQRGMRETRVTSDGTAAVATGNYVVQAYGTGAYIMFSPDDQYVVYAKNHHTYLYNVKEGWVYDALLPDQDIFITRILWTNSGRDFLVAYLHREQKRMSVVKVSIKDPAAKTVVRKLYSYAEGKYISPENASEMLVVGHNRFVLLENREGFNRIKLFDLESGKSVSTLVSGKFDVTDLYGYDEKTQSVFYQSDENGRENRGVYRVTINGQKTPLAVEEGTNSALFSNDYKHFELSYSNRTTPHIYSVRSAADGKELRELSRDTFSDDIVREEMDFDGCKGWVLYKKGAQKPQLVLSVEDHRNQWMQDIAYYLAGQGYMVARVYPNKKAKGLSIFTVAAEDYLKAAAWLIRHQNCDGKNVFMLGNRLSGGVVLAALLHEKSIISGGVIISPVTDLVSHKSEELEQMLKQEQGEITFDGRVANFVAKAGHMNGKLLLMHAMNDGFFSAENTYRMVDKLKTIGADVQMQVLPASDESMTGSQLQSTLYTNILRFIKLNSK